MYHDLRMFIYLCWKTRQKCLMMAFVSIILPKHTMKDALKYQTNAGFFGSALGNRNNSNLHIICENSPPPGTSFTFHWLWHYTRETSQRNTRVSPSQKHADEETPWDSFQWYTGYICNVITAFHKHGLIDDVHLSGREIRPDLSVSLCAVINISSRTRRGH